MASRLILFPFSFRTPDRKKGGGKGGKAEGSISDQEIATEGRGGGHIVTEIEKEEEKKLPKFSGELREAPI